MFARNFVAFAIICGALSGCAGFKEPLSPPKDAEYDKEVFGIWASEEKTEDGRFPREILHVGPADQSGGSNSVDQNFEGTQHRVPFENMTRVIIVSQDNSSGMSSVSWLGYPTLIGERKYASVPKVDENGDVVGYIYSKYELDGNELTLWAHANPDAVDQLVKEGKLHEDETDNLIMAGPEGMEAMLTNGGDAVMFPDEDKMVYHRIILQGESFGDVSVEKNHISHDGLFRMIFLGLFSLLLPIAVYHRIKSKTREKLDRWQEGLLILFGLRFGAVPWFLGSLAWMINPQWMKWSFVPMPMLLRWCGVVLIVLWGILLVWTFRSLGKNLTDTVVTRREHTLVTSGPYHFVRHPFYLAFFLMIIGESLVAANWFLFVTGLIPAGFLIARTRIEENKLIERFGDEYRNYRESTGRFIPWKIGREKSNPKMGREEIGP